MVGNLEHVRRIADQWLRFCTEEELLQIKRALVSLLIKVQCPSFDPAELPGPHNGICFNLRALLKQNGGGYVNAYTVVRHLSTTWAHYSGSSNFPVPDSLYMVGARSIARSALQPDSWKWYGRPLELRIDLLRHILGRVMEERNRRVSANALALSTELAKGHADHGTLTVVPGRTVTGRVRLFVPVDNLPKQHKWTTPGVYRITSYRSFRRYKAAGARFTALDPASCRGALVGVVSVALARTRAQLGMPLWAVIK